MIENQSKIFLKRLSQNLYIKQPFEDLLFPIIIYVLCFKITQLKTTLGQKTKVT